MVLVDLTTQEIEYDLMMVQNRFGLLVDNVIASGQDITPQMAYYLESMDASRARLEEYLPTTVTPNQS